MSLLDGKVECKHKGEMSQARKQTWGVGGGPGQAEPDFSSQRETVSTETLIRVGQP